MHVFFFDAIFYSSSIILVQTGADGCICYLEYDRVLQNLQFTGMKRVKELSLIEYASIDNNYFHTLSRRYAAGFASVDFIVWNLTNETKVLNCCPHSCLQAAVSLCLSFYISTYYNCDH